MSGHTVENPPAFPRGAFQEGMSLRDWFAGQTFAALMAGAQNLGPHSPAERRVIFDQLAAIVYESADAMLAARATSPESPAR